MDGREIIHVYRQITIRYNIVNQPEPQPDRTQLLAIQPAPRQNHGCIHAVIILILYAIAISILVIGALHLNDCPAQKLIPMSMTILGAMFLLERVLNCVYDIRRICESDDDDLQKPTCLSCINIICILARFGLFITLCYWVFSLNYTPTPGIHDLPIQNYTSAPGDQDLPIQTYTTTSTPGDQTYLSVQTYTTSTPADHDLLKYCEPSFYKTAYGGCIAGLVLYALSFCCCFLS